MKLNTYLWRIASCGLCLLICISGLTQTALAAKSSNPTEKLPLDKKCSLTLEFPAKMKISLYRVANVDENIVYTPANNKIKDVLASKGVDLNEPRTANEWRKLAGSLRSGFAGFLWPKADVEKTTQEINGKFIVEFTDLKPGLYLIENDIGFGTKVIDGEEKEVNYQPTPYLICLPNWMTTAANPEYHWETDIKADYSNKIDFIAPINPGPDPENPPGYPLRVSKIWLDENGKKLNENEHPNSIQVQLWRDNELYETVTLNQSNGWTKTWDKLDAKHRWTITEVPVDGYTTDIDRLLFNYLITNTVKPPDDPDDPYTPPDDPKDPDDPPDDPDNPPDNPDDPDDPYIPPDEPDIPTPPIDIDDPDVPLGKPDLPKDPTEPYEIIEIDDTDVPLANLPQTGQLWWPVPLLAVSGLFLFLIGWVKHRGAQNEE